jgi:endo-chitodextinase
MMRNPKSTRRWTAACLATLLLLPTLATATTEATVATTTSPATGPTVTLAAVGVSGPVAAGTDVLLRATITTAATPRYVRFLEGNKDLGTDRFAPWEFTVRKITEGTHTYRAEVRGLHRSVVFSPTVTVTAKAAVNQAPTVSILTPAGNASFVQGSTVDLTADARDADGTIQKVEYWKDSTLLGSATAPPYKLSYPAATLGNIAVYAKAYDNAGAVTKSAAVTFSVVLPTPTAKAADDAVRLLLQATFGPSSADVDRVHALGVSGWVAEQLATPLTYSHVEYLKQAEALTGKKAEEEHAYEAIWQNFLFGADQLRARMAFALSEIIVISNIAPDQDTWALASWMDMLYRNAFGNYRTLLEDATLHPAMGYYLNMLGNDRENPTKGYRPNENYARELLQLFSIGLTKLNLDGTPVLDASGKPVPTYDQSVVEGFAQVFTGWSFAGNDTTSNSAFYYPKVEDWLDPMVPWPKRHSAGTKQLLDGAVLPANQTPQQDLKDALDNVFNHPNVGPFVARRLIQFFVTSNPSPGYISRVASRFNNNGKGERGDLSAVIAAVLTDAEARSTTLAAGATFGKLREPVIRFTHLMRATGAKADNGRNSVWWLDSPEDALGQSPLLAPSVFNFFSPFFARPGPIAAAGLVSPEFQIHTETQVVGSANFLSDVLWNRGFGFRTDGKLRMDLAPWQALAADATALTEAINLVFTANSLSVATRASMAKAVAAVPAAKTYERVRVALTLLMVAPDFVVQH